MPHKFSPAQALDIQAEAAKAIEEDRFDFETAAHELNKCEIRTPDAPPSRMRIDPPEAEEWFMLLWNVFLKDQLDDESRQVFLSVLLAGLGFDPGNW